MAPIRIPTQLLLISAFCFLKATYDKLPQGSDYAQNLIVAVGNGSLAGVYSSPYRQDLFLGVPYAQAPVGEKRFQPPISLNTSWKGVRDVTHYGPSCVGYGSELAGYPTSEDCLSLNIVRPHPRGDQPRKKLPVVVWIHGGGFFTGSSSLKQYNMSRLVLASVNEGHPIIGVSINYRLSAFGWLWSKDVKENNGSANVGFLDQRLALHWIQENIAHFGGDPSRVVIFGESAGAQSVGMHLIAYGGRDDGLFSGAIMQSGSCLQRWPLWVAHPPSYREEAYQNLTDATGCTNAVSPFKCLQHAPFSQLNAALNVTNTWMPGTGLGPFIATYDGEIIQDFPSKLVQRGDFVKIPILYGTNSDEGTVNGKFGIDSDRDFRHVLAEAGLNQTSIKIYEALYPTSETIEVPATYQKGLHNQQGNGESSDHGIKLGRQWKRISAFYGDVSQHTPRRVMVDAWAKHRVPSYSYRFDIKPANIPGYLGATHGVEIPFVFNNVHGWGFKLNPFGPAHHPLHQAYIDASNLMTKMWISFTNNLDPNEHSLLYHPEWPLYKPDNDKIGSNFVFAVDANTSSFSPYIESDVWRNASIDYINQNAVQHWYR